MPKPPKPVGAPGRQGEQTNGTEPLYSATFSSEMQLENSFNVGAPPDQVFAYLLDVNKVVGCVPGAELSEVVDPTTFKGRGEIQGGPITGAYNGNAPIRPRARHTQPGQ